MILPCGHLFQEAFGVPQLSSESWPPPGLIRGAFGLSASLGPDPQLPEN